MIGEKIFFDWMVNKKGLGEGAANSNVSRIKRIDNVYDVFDSYLKDGCAYLLSLFEYSKSDVKQGLQPEHDIVISGDYYTGTQSLKYALKLYIEYMDDDVYFGAWLKATASSVKTGEEKDIYDITDEEFDELFDGIRQMEITNINISEMLDALKDNYENSLKEHTDKTATYVAPTMFFGNFKNFLRYVGQFCKNHVNYITKAERNLHKGICEYCGRKEELQSAHKEGEDRPIIIKNILETHFKKSEDYYEVDLVSFEKMFKDAHLPVQDHIFFLCKKCHDDYDKRKVITTADILAKRDN